jgi:hypothetical protein
MNYNTSTSTIYDRAGTAPLVVISEFINLPEPKNNEEQPDTQDQKIPQHQSKRQEEPSSKLDSFLRPRLSSSRRLSNMKDAQRKTRQLKKSFDFFQK